MPSSDYHDYVIKDGKLIGEFDAMYRNADDIPWHQDETANAVFSDLDVAILNYFQRRFGFASLLEIGSGLGYFAERLRQDLGGAVAVTGMDVSETAVAKAATLFPEVRFECVDLLNDDMGGRAGAFDLVMEKEVLWYVLADVERFFANMALLSKRYVYVSQSFPDTPRFLGSDRFPDAAALEAFVGERFHILHSATERDPQYGGRELIHIFAEKR